jgi:hypothetical protein
MDPADLHSYRTLRARYTRAVDALRWVRYHARRTMEARAREAWAAWLAGGWRGRP